jgi:transketolase
MDTKKKIGGSTRTACAEEMLELAGRHPDLVAVGTDGPSAFEYMARAYPARYFDVGIAEMTAAGVAAGLARSGKKVCVTAIASFLVRRAFEQIRIDVVDPGLDVTIIGHGAGLGYGLLGSTHLLVEDVTVFESMPTAGIFSPADIPEMVWSLRQAVRIAGPAYVRVPAEIGIEVGSAHVDLEPGQPRPLRSGDDVCILASGPVTAHALEAAERLARVGIRCTVASFPALRPFDAEAVSRLCRRHRAGVVTVAEHSRSGGLGHLVLDALGATAIPVVQLAIDDRRPPVGDYDELCRFYRLDTGAVKEAVIKLMSGGYRMPSR